jgi:hypothetical protein
VLSAAHLSEVRPTYLRLRDVQRTLNTTLFRTVSKKGIEESARALDFWERGKVVLEEEDDVGVLMDFAIYEYRAGGDSRRELSILLCTHARPRCRRWPQPHAKL